MTGPPADEGRGLAGVIRGQEIFHGEGWLADLSKTGCRIVGTPLPIPGTPLNLFLDLNDGKAPLTLHGATVSWASDTAFGVQFSAMPAEDRHRLQLLVLKFVSLGEASQAHTAFRIS